MVTNVITPGVQSTARPRGLLQVLYRRILSFPVVAAFALALTVFLMLPKSVADPDIWWHLRNVQVELALHGLLRHDIYSYTAPGALWINHEWLSELPYYFAWHAFGVRGLFVVFVSAVEAVLLGVYYLAWRSTRNTMAALLASFVAAWFATVSFGPRTLLFGWVCLVIELIILGRVREHARVAWLLPPLFVLWVNTHGSWLIGLTLLGVFCACNAFDGSWGSIQATRLPAGARRNLFAAAAASLLGLFANPYGWRLVAYPFDLAWKQRLNVANVQEWQSLDFHSLRGKIMIAALALMILFALVRRRDRPLHQVAFLLISIYSALTYSRFMFLAGILLAPMLAEDIADLLSDKEREERPLLNLCSIAIMATLVAFLFPSAARLGRDLPSTYPERALQHLPSLHLQGNVFNDYAWGGYLELNSPTVPMFIDSRVDIFERAGALKDYLDAVRIKNSLAVLDKYHVRYVFFERDAPLVYLLEHTSLWRIDYQDSTAVLLERTTP